MHVHEWRWHSEYGEDGIDCRICAEIYGYRPENWLDRGKAIAMLNAAEKLSVLDAQMACSRVAVWGAANRDDESMRVADALDAYAKARCAG